MCRDSETELTSRLVAQIVVVSISYATDTFVQPARVARVVTCQRSKVETNGRQITNLLALVRLVWQLKMNSFSNPNCLDWKTPTGWQVVKFAFNLIERVDKNWLLFHQPNSFIHRSSLVTWLTIKSFGRLNDLRLTMHNNDYNNYYYYCYDIPACCHLNSPFIMSLEDVAQWMWSQFGFPACCFLSLVNFHLLFELLA